MNVVTTLLAAIGAGLFAGCLAARWLDRIAGDAWDPRRIER